MAREGERPERGRGERSSEGLEMKQHVGYLPEVRAAVFRLAELVPLFRVQYCQYTMVESSGTSGDESHDRVHENEPVATGRRFSIHLPVGPMMRDIHPDQRDGWGKRKGILTASRVRKTSRDGPTGRPFFGVVDSHAVLCGQFSVMRGWGHTNPGSVNETYQHKTIRIPSD